MTILEALDEVLRKHFGKAEFGVAGSLREGSHFWAGLILDADLDEAIAFGMSEDVVRLEELQRLANQCLAAIDNLGPGTRRFMPKTRAYEFIANRLEGHGEARVFKNARLAVMELNEWVGELRREPTFREQARRGKNWRAASIARTCRLVWGHAQWDIQGREVTRNALAITDPVELEAARRTALEQAEFIENCAPTAVKYDEPGPFGRFLEDVFEVMGVVGRDGERLSAHTALRALSQTG